MDNRGYRARSERGNFIFFDDKLLGAGIYRLPLFSIEYSVITTSTTFIDNIVRCRVIINLNPSDFSSIQELALTDIYLLTSSQLRV